MQKIGFQTKECLLYDNQNRGTSPQTNSAEYFAFFLSVEKLNLQQVTLLLFPTNSDALELKKPG